MLTLSPLATPTSEAPAKFTVAVTVPSSCLQSATAAVIVSAFAVMFAIRPLGCETL